MELINYLNKTFFTKQQLLDVSKVTEQQLLKYQQDGVMPKCSYRLNLTFKSDSFLGEYNDVQEVEYYAKGYSSWLAIVQSLDSKDVIYSVFSTRYKAAINQLNEQGHYSENPKITSGLDAHIQDEWQHFLNGTYGLCTKSGLPEDIAAKEFSIIVINELSQPNQLTSEQTNKLRLAVDLLDSASSWFAPHERLTSSRHRLVNEIRRKYQLEKKQ